MKVYGDIPKEHSDHVVELINLLGALMLRKDALPNLEFSKGILCIAHDYFQMDMEEEGEKYLNVADEHSPGYFIAPILSQMKKDVLFNILVNNLIDNPFALNTMIMLGFENE